MTAPRPLGYWVKTVDRMLDEQFEAQAESHGLSRLEWQLLSRLRTSAVAVDAVGAALAPPSGEGQSIEEAMDGLCSKGYAERQATEYRLTDSGHAKADEVQDVSLQQILDRALDGLTPEDADRLVSTLERIATNLGWQPT
ncbi:MAG TPA: hypothetical protein VD859_00695 [Nocardioides sp.]|nr:hypothetical protein [Nocardioides sp.]